MPRNPRYLSNTNYFHVMTQGVNKSYIFDSDIDIKHYIKKMYKIKEKYPINIIAYCIMNNHTHMLIEAKSINDLSKFMHRINTSYAHYYNNKYNRVGHLFRDRFKSQAINDERQLLNCINYIFNNPVKAKMCNHASEYPYSNYFDLGKFEKKEYDFLELFKDTKEKCKIVVEDFLFKNNLSKNQLFNNKSKLNELIILSKNTYSISSRKLSNEINISRFYIDKVIREQINSAK